MALQHIRSSTANKRAIAANLADGQIAINYHVDSPGIFIKDTNSTLAKIGPIHVGTTAPNSTPAGSSGNSKGEGWLDTSGANPVLKIWNGTAWTTVNSVASGSIVTTADTGTVTSTMIADGTIVDADVSASAAIAHSKLANITAGQILLGNASNVPTATAVSGDITIGSTGVTAIAAGAIVNADVNASAAIAGSKITPAFGAQNISTTARCFVGITSARTTAFGDIGHFQVEGEGKSVVHTHTGVNAFSNAYVFIKVRGTGTQAVLSDDSLGIFSFQGADGTGYVRAAQIEAFVDGAPGTNDMPGRLVFSTTTDGQSVPTERMRIDSTGVVTIQGTAALAVPDGTTAERPGTPAAGMIRLNTSLGQFEGYSGSAWGTIGGGAKGGGPDQVFFENDQAVTTDYTMTSGKNAVTAGPVTINNGITVTVPSGSVWSIV